MGLFEALETDDDLRAHFVNTVVSFHTLPSQNPAFELRIYDGQLAQTGTTVECVPTNWTKLVSQLEKCNIYLRYTFTIAGILQSTDSSKSTITLTEGQLAETVSIKCAVTLWAWYTNKRSRKFRKLDMRKYHCDMFTVERTFRIFTDGNNVKTLQVNALKRAASDTGEGGTPAKQTPPDTTATTRETIRTTGNQVNPIPGTSKTDSPTVLPLGERKRADQELYKIQKSMNRVVGKHPGALNPTVWEALQGKGSE